MHFLSEKDRRDNSNDAATTKPGRLATTAMAATTATMATTTAKHGLPATTAIMVATTATPATGDVWLSDAIAADTATSNATAKETACRLVDCYWCVRGCVGALWIPRIWCIFSVE